jgi:hypothetical protein
MNTISLLSLLLLATSGAADTVRGLKGPKGGMSPKEASKNPNSPKSSSSSKTSKSPKTPKTPGHDTVIPGATCWTTITPYPHDTHFHNAGYLYVDFSVGATLFEVSPGNDVHTPRGPEFVALVYNDNSAARVNAAIVVGGTTYVVIAFEFENVGANRLKILWGQVGEQENVAVPLVPEASPLPCTVFLGEDDSSLIDLGAFPYPP